MFKSRCKAASLLNIPGHMTPGKRRRPLNIWNPLDRNQSIKVFGVFVLCVTMRPCGPRASTPFPQSENIVVFPVLSPCFSSPCPPRCDPSDINISDEMSKTTVWKSLSSNQKDARPVAAKKARPHPLSPPNSTVTCSKNAATVPTLSEGRSSLPSTTCESTFVFVLFLFLQD